MTIAKRLLILVAVPLLALIGLGVFSRLQLANIEARSRFVAENQVVGLATLGNISRGIAELRVNMRSFLLATNQAELAGAQSAFDDEAASDGCGQRARRGPSPRDSTLGATRPPCAAAEPLPTDLLPVVTVDSPSPKLTLKVVPCPSATPCFTSTASSRQPTIAPLRSGSAGARWQWSRH